MYKPPITLNQEQESITAQIARHANEQMESDVLKFISRYGIEVDKDELLKALRYDREQYETGFRDGYEKRDEEIVRCKDCEKRYTEDCLMLFERDYIDSDGDWWIDDIEHTDDEGYCHCGERRND